MPAAAKVGDTTNHGGTIIGPGDATVLMEGSPAVVATDNHVCSLPPNTHQPTTSPFTVGSTTVFIGGKPAIRVGDTCICGAASIVGAPSIQIG